MEDKQVKAGSVAVGICLFIIAILLVLIVVFFYNTRIEKNNLQKEINQLEMAIQEKDEKINELNEEVSEQEPDANEHLLEVKKDEEEKISKNEKYEENKTKNQNVEEKVNSNEEANEPQNNFEQANNQEQEVNNEELNQSQNNFEQSNNEQEEINNEDASQTQEDIIESKKNHIKGCIRDAFSLTHAEAFANYYMSDQSISREEYIADFYTLENIKNNFGYKANLEVVDSNVFKVIDITDDNKIYFAKVTLAENMIVQNVEIFTEEEYNQ